ncbi:hypothetical protein [Isoptericola variabilis]|uniref:Uncharacterized protein n=1 Tax=Isoptericola variabilis (strain 225) TaxID=743718 RepID=F6FPG0_ISOV2|nr:hypothetical protein [Isoptericola variabilis]AEG43673.1 hypothetical protein Isova_0889 [Isoptericola variabilis 225]TWH27354.1 hypothetical protein L600_000500000270 [Isoptericola variabilis J7]
MRTNTHQLPGRMVPAVGSPLELEIWVGEDAPDDGRERARRTAAERPSGSRRLVGALGALAGVLIGVPLGAGAVALASEIGPASTGDDVAGDAAELRSSAIPSGVDVPWFLEAREDDGMVVLELGEKEWLLMLRVDERTRDDAGMAGAVAKERLLDCVAGVTGTRTGC